MTLVKVYCLCGKHLADVIPTALAVKCPSCNRWRKLEKQGRGERQ